METSHNGGIAVRRSLDEIFAEIATLQPVSFDLEYRPDGSILRDAGWVASWRAGSSFKHSSIMHTRSHQTIRGAVEEAVSHLRMAAKPIPFE